MTRGGTRTTWGEVLRIRVLLLAMLVLLGLLAAALWRVQVARGREFQVNLEEQSVRRVRLPGGRGRILDRHGRPLAGNRPSYGIAIYLEELRQSRSRRRTEEAVMDLLNDLGGIVGREVKLRPEDIRIHMRKRLPLPLLAWRDLNEAELARFAERAGTRPGVDVFIEAVRVYPEDRTACHLLGSVGRTKKVEHAEQPYHYLYPETVGRSGLEMRYDDLLRGTAGGRLLRVDVAGFRHEDLAVREPMPGSDILLAIDLKAQRAAERAIRDIEGAAVVMDPRNGDVLALASSPTFDPNAFIPAMSQQAWTELTSDPRKPLLNRAAAGTYAPGSVFKPVVAFAALENGKIGGGTMFSCPGYFELGGTRFACWLKSGHGTQNVRKAIRNSCNVFFFETGLLCGRGMIVHMAAAMGLGEATGIELDHEVGGSLPFGRRDRGWYRGDTCNISIGQGPITVTPLQMAVMVSAIANGGQVLWPRLVVGTRPPGQDAFDPIPPKVVNRMNWSTRSLALVRGGMRDVVMDPRGTGRLARVPGLDVAGKTGTAEFGAKGNEQKRAWMIAYAPAEHPRYAIALIVDKGQGGGVNAAPRMQTLLSELFDIPLPESEVDRG